jgi:16S rRNA U516 pseudouridylate synthase RsuA-like enzyme
VRQLMRVGVGPIMLGDLGEGKWRYLSEEEVGRLRRDDASEGGAL